MFIMFNGILLNLRNVISFRKGDVDKSGKYPIYADHVMHDSGIDAYYQESYVSRDMQTERFNEIQSMLLGE